MKKPEVDYLNPSFDNQLTYTPVYFLHPDLFWERIHDIELAPESQQVEGYLIATTTQAQIKNRNAAAVDLRRELTEAFGNDQDFRRILTVIDTRWDNASQT